MEALLDQADALVHASNGEEPTRPDFSIPEEYSAAVVEPTSTSTTTTSDSSVLHTNNMKLRQTSDGKGRGWFATRNLPAGTVLNVAKPIEMVMDWEDDSHDDEEEEDDIVENDNEEDNMDDEDEKEPRLNEMLLLRILEKLAEDPSLWTTQLSTLFPRDDVDLSALPAWICHNDDVFIQVESLLEVLGQQQQEQQQLVLPVKEISKRLPLIIRYNILSVETLSELLSYPGPNGHSSLAGVGLYHAPSFFNHSARPNVSRWAVGDVMCFVTNQDVVAGSELCISYIEHDVLCEPAWRRNLMLSMDFQESDGNDNNDPTGNTRDGEPTDQIEDGPELPVVDNSVQNELMSMDPFERLLAIDELMEQALGHKPPQDEEEESSSDGNPKDESAMETSPELSTWFQCDVHNLRILKAITLDGMGKTREALKLWEESIAFVDTKLPPADESSVVLRAQAALCALHAEEEVLARQHAAKALETHHLLFGGGVARFRRRLGNDLKLSLRPASKASGSPIDILWPQS